MFEERAAAVRPPPPHTPLLKITNLGLPSRYHKVFCCKSQARLDVGTYLWVTFWSSGLTTSPHPRIHNEDGHHPPLHTLSMIVIDICTVSIIPRSSIATASSVLSTIAILVITPSAS